jgi:hypothetical protein
MQTSSLLYRRRWRRDKAGWKPALQQAGSLRYAQLVHWFEQFETFSEQLVT